MKTIARSGALGFEDLSKLTWVVGDVAGAEVEEPCDFIEHANDHPRRAQVVEPFSEVCEFLRRCPT